MQTLRTPGDRLAHQVGDVRRANGPHHRTCRRWEQRVMIRLDGGQATPDSELNARRTLNKACRRPGSTAAKARSPPALGLIASISSPGSGTTRAFDEGRHRPQEPPTAVAVREGEYFKGGAVPPHGCEAAEATKE